MIPDRLTDFKLIRVYGPNADCDHPGKQPVGSTKTGPFYHADDPKLCRWIKDGGNVGLPLDGPLVVFDVDHGDFGQLLSDRLPPTFTVRTGSGFDHRYYHSPDWTTDHQFTVDGQDFGSIRSDGWQVVIPPSVHPETGDRYEVIENRQITSVGRDAIAAVVKDASNRSDGKPSNRQHGAAPGRVGGSDASRRSTASVPDGYPNRPVGWPTVKKWLAANRADGQTFLDKLTSRSHKSDWSGHEFTIAKCLAEGGFSFESIADALDRLPPQSKWHRRGDRYKRQTVINAIRAAIDDPHVSFDGGHQPAYKSDSSDERRKTETTGANGGLTGRHAGNQGGDSEMVSFNDQYEVTILEGVEEGDSTKKLTLVEGTDEDGDTFEFVSLKKGVIREGQTDDGQTVTFEDIQDSKSLGSPDHLDDLIDGLRRLQGEIEQTADASGMASAETDD